MDGVVAPQEAMLEPVRPVEEEVVGDRRDQHRADDRQRADPGKGLKGRQGQ